MARQCGLRCAKCGTDFCSRTPSASDVNVIIKTQRGYHVQFRCASSFMSVWLSLMTRKCFLRQSSMLCGWAGRSSLAALRRLRTTIARRSFCGLPESVSRNLDQQFHETCVGYRPCLSNSVPITGTVHGLPELWLATGHGHLGLADSVGTATEIADGVQSQVLSS